MIKCNCCLVCVWLREVPRLGLGCALLGVGVHSNYVCKSFKSNAKKDEQ